MPILLPNGTPVTLQALKETQTTDHNQENPSTDLVLSRSSARLLRDGVLLPLQCQYPKSLPPHHLHFNSLLASSHQFLLHLFWNRVFGDKWHSKLAATLRWFTAAAAMRIAVRQLSQTWKLRHYEVITRKL